MEWMIGLGALVSFAGIAGLIWCVLLALQARKTAADWCAMGADVQFWTNEEPPLFNKLDINNLLPVYVDGERSMAWISDRFNGLPTTPNCDELVGTE